jgi:hypothetical protein
MNQCLVAQVAADWETWLVGDDNELLLQPFGFRLPLASVDGHFSRKACEP